jgi:deazaflavin-dependent oxidoreductase (nitroreductase family)
MPLEGEYVPSAWEPVADQVALYEKTGGEEGREFLGGTCIILTTLGNKSGKVRKTPLMRVEHEGRYAVVASLGGAPDHPVWYHNVVAHPLVMLQDGADCKDYTAREVTGQEKAEWWVRAVAAYPAYADYQASTERVIPLFVLSPVS